MQADGFSKWGFVIYRCTYTNGADWEAFMARIYDAVIEYLELYNGLDMLDSFAPTVIEDRAAFEGATTATLREHFVNTWVPSAFPGENPGLDMDVLSGVEAGRYRFFIMIDEESLRSVLDATVDGINRTGFVRLVQAGWGAKRPYIVEEEDDKIEYTPEECEPLEGCTLQDVGWMSVRHDHVEAIGYLDIRMHWDWEDHYSRPPEIAKIL